MAQESWLIIVKGKQGKYGEIPSQQPLRLQSDYLPCVKDCFSGNRRKEQPFIVFEKFNARIFGRFFKEFYMKKLVTLLLCVALACAFLCGCAQKTKVLKETDKFIVITPSEDFVGKTLKECMDDLKDRGELDFTEQDSAYGAFINSVNGIENTSSMYWMLYTDDAENSDDWSKIEYQSKTYKIANYGASGLVVAKGCIYIWVYTESSY